MATPRGFGRVTSRTLRADAARRWFVALFDAKLDEGNPRSPNPRGSDVEVEDDACDDAAK